MQWIANFWRKPGPSGFGASSTAEEVTQGVDATGITAIVTGGTSGIGRETVRVLALRGAEVIMPARNIQAGQKIKEEILKDNPNAKVDVMELDLGSLRSVRKFAEAFKAMDRSLNILVNNAGIMACPFQLSNEGIELQFATNHLGHFLLTNLLLDKIKATANTTGIEGRIINVSSAAHMRTYPEGVRLDKINSEEGYKPMASYGQSKLANILHMNELSRHLREEVANVTANSLHPGVIPTNITRYIKIFAFPMAIAKFMLKNAQQGAATTCFLALHPYVKGVSGKYFSDCSEADPSSHAQDPVLARELWRLSEDFISKVNQAD